MYLAKCCKIVTGTVPLDINNLVANGDYISMKNYGHATVILQFGAVGTSTAITLTQAKEVAGSTTKALSFKNVWENLDTAATDTLVETTATGSNTHTQSVSTPNLLAVLEIDARELDVNNGYDCFRVNYASGSGTTLLSILYILSEARFVQDTLPSAIID